MREVDAPVAIVTGASSGIGEAAARCLARAGFRVALAARRGELLEAIGKAISEAGGSALPVPTDLADESATARLVARTLEAFNRVDVLVNDAGFSPAAALEQLSRAELRQVFEVNLLGALQLVAQLAPVMREQGGGRIINVGSLAARVPAPLAVAYSATKGGMHAANDCLRLELAPWNIRVVRIVPGFVDTPTFENSRRMGEALRADPENPYRELMFELDAFARKSLERALSPDDVGRVVVRAARARRPRAVYYVPFSARVQSGLLGALPARVLDPLLLRVYRGRS